MGNLRENAKALQLIKSTTDGKKRVHKKELEIEPSINMKFSLKKNTR